jgi:DNA-directed RNA polymerase subunit RPC12/RpoP
MPPLLLLKNDLASRRTPLALPDLDRDGDLTGIRCPQCDWRPSGSSRWCCIWYESPEPRFDACGAEWNTFTTRGRCPGCGHQWRWTSCLRCGEWSPHEDWYETGETGR